MPEPLLLEGELEFVMLSGGAEGVTPVELLLEAAGAFELRILSGGAEGKTTGPALI